MTKHYLKWLLINMNPQTFTTRLKWAELAKLPFLSG